MAISAATLQTRCLALALCQNALVSDISTNTTFTKTIEIKAYIKSDIVGIWLIHNDLGANAVNMANAPIIVVAAMCRLRYSFNVDLLFALI